MSEETLQDILKAEKEAGERIKKAQEDAERLRKTGAERAARIEAEATEKVENERREALRNLQEEAAEFHTRTLKEAEDTVAQWQRRCDEKKEDITNKLCRMITGET